MFNKLAQDKTVKDQSRNLDLKGRRVINAGNSKNLQDYITRAELLSAAVSAGSGAITSFTDSLMRASSTLGVNWAVIQSDYSASGFALPKITMLSTGVEFQNGSGGGAAMDMLLQAQVLSAIIGQSQYAQLTLVTSATSAYPSGGPCVAGTGDPLSGGSNGYWANIQPPNGFLQVRYANKGQTLVQDSIGSGITAGSVVRLNVVFGTSSNVVQVFIGGVLKTTITDTSSSRPTTGLPGIYIQGISSGDSLVFSTFSAGTGL